MRISKQSSPVVHVVVCFKVKIILLFPSNLLLFKVILELLRILNDKGHVREGETDEVTQIHPVVELGVEAMTILGAKGGTVLPLFVALVQL